MKTLSFALLLLVVALYATTIVAEPRVQRHRGVALNHGFVANNNHPYLFLNVPQGRSGSIVRGFEVVEDDDDDDENYNDDDFNDAVHDDDDDDDEADNGDDDDDRIGGVHQRSSSTLSNDNDDADDDDNDDDDDNENGNTSANEENNTNAMMMHSIGKVRKTSTAANLQMILQNAKPTQMMVAKEHAGAIMVPDGVIEIQGQSIIDEKTGKAALLVPRAALDAIPNGSVVALMERSADPTGETEEERANRVIVRRRRRGSRRNVRRRGGLRVKNGRRRRRGGNRRRRRGGNKRRKNVRVVRPGGNRRRRRGNRRRRNGRPVVVQG